MAEELATRAGIGLSKRRGEQDYWEVELPQALSDAAVKMPEHRYDAIVVDEAQDIDAVWWLPLLDLLADPARARLPAGGEPPHDARHPRLGPALGVIPPGPDRYRRPHHPPPRGRPRRPPGRRPHLPLRGGDTEIRFVSGDMYRGCGPHARAVIAMQHASAGSANPIPEVLKIVRRDGATA